MGNVGESVLKDMHGTLRWIHHDLTDSSFAPLMRDVVTRLARLPSALQKALIPLVSMTQGKPNAACYFKMLDGDVATLGGVRAAEGSEELAAELLVSQIDHLRRLGVPQIQAVVPDHDKATPRLVVRAGLNSLTHVQHQWLDLEGMGSQAPTPQMSSLLWRPADTFARSRFARLIEGTFEQTLDCPVLNGLRDSSQVLDGFLDGRRLRGIGKLWEVLEFRGELAGCLLLQPHDQGILELSYLGLLPQARGNGLGKQLVQRAIAQAVNRQTQALVAAVDEQNWPAIDLYSQFGFYPQQRFEVWLHTS